MGWKLVRGSNMIRWKGSVRRFAENMAQPAELSTENKSGKRSLRSSIMVLISYKQKKYTLVDIIGMLVITSSIRTRIRILSS